MIPNPTYILPAQAVVFERGPLAGLPGISAAFSSGWFDTFQVLAGDIVVPQTGAIVSAESEVITGAGTVAAVGAFFLDLFVEHANPTFLSCTVQVEAQIAQALQSPAPPTMFLAELIVPTQDPGTGDRRPFTSRVVVMSRFVRVNVVYPAVAATRFNMSAVLRAS